MVVRQIPDNLNENHNSLGEVIIDIVMMFVCWFVNEELGVHSFRMWEARYKTLSTWMMLLQMKMVKSCLHLKDIFECC